MPFDFLKWNNRQADRIGAHRRARGKNAARLRVQERHNRQLRMADLVEMVKQDDVRESFQVLQSADEFRIDFDHPRCAGLSTRLNRHISKVLEWTVDNAYWVKDNIHGFRFRSCYSVKDCLR